jgi:cysteine sulfinate desulfinase/cysteine desulfurase-like protein
MTCLQQLESENLCQLTILNAERSGPFFGTILPANLDEALRQNTCFISIVAANGEIAAINNLVELSRIARVSKIPFHTDLSQLFGRTPTNIHALGIDSFSTSFHKIGGPPGVGILVVRNKLLDGYELAAQITGSQNDGMRGGVENVPGIGAAFMAYKLCMKNRIAKTAAMQKMRVTLKTILNENLQCYDMSDHEPSPLASVDGGITVPEKVPWTASSTVKKNIKAADKKSLPIIFWFPTDDRRTLPNTLSFCVRNMNAEKIRAEMHKHGIIIGATQTSLATLNIHPNLRNGFVRISFTDLVVDVDFVAQKLIEVLRRRASSDE